jgi:hypothetical protein
MLVLRRVLPALFLSVILWLVSLAPLAQERAGRYVPVQPGPSMSRVGASAIGIGNKALMATWSIAGGRLKPESFEDKLSSRKVPVAEEAFVLTLAGGRLLRASEMRITRSARQEPLAANPKASRLSERSPGKQLVVSLEPKDGAFQVTWCAIVRDGSNYVRQQLTLTAGKTDLVVTDIALLALAAPGASVAGTVQGSPVVLGSTFMGIEHPMSECRMEGDIARCALHRDVPIRAGRSFSVASVIGVAPGDQLRRGFLNYVERERAHPYRTFLHYNTWYDLGYFSKFDEAASLDVIEAYGRELVRKRGVRMDSFLFDDGWDDPQTLWKFHGGFPNGFAPLKQAAAKYGAAPGVWLSPWGGYSEPKKQRLAFGQQQGFETNRQGFALSGPVYYKRFHDTCLDFVRTYGVNQFKFDGIGRATGTIPASEFGSDFEAAIQLIDDLRVEKPDLYVNLTTGTWPSPFWLQYADSIWRGGEDHDFAGVGSDRQRWITYRDGDTYAGIVKKGPLYPVSSLMLHGLIFAKLAKQLNTDPHDDFASEVRDYFGTGTQLQEMYITPSLLTDRNWDVLAEAAKWSRQNQDVLVDTHWIGGDPRKLEVYGWASWTPAKAILVLRNPGDKAATYGVDVQEAFEIPAGQPTTYRARSPWKEDQARPAIELQAGKPYTFTLKPFEVLTLDAVPVVLKTK